MWEGIECKIYVTRAFLLVHKQFLNCPGNTLLARIHLAGLLPLSTWSLMADNAGCNNNSAFSENSIIFTVPLMEERLASS